MHAPLRHTVAVILGRTSGTARHPKGVIAPPPEGSCAVYWRAMAARISLSLSVMSSPDTSTVTECRVPVNR